MTCENQINNGQLLHSLKLFGQYRLSSSFVNYNIYAACCLDVTTWKQMNPVNPE